MVQLLRSHTPPCRAWLSLLAPAPHPAPLNEDPGHKDATSRNCSPCGDRDQVPIFLTVGRVDIWRAKMKFTYNLKIQCTQVSLQTVFSHNYRKSPFKENTATLTSHYFYRWRAPRPCSRRRVQAGLSSGQLRSSRGSLSFWSFLSCFSRGDLLLLPRHLPALGSWMDTRLLNKSVTFQISWNTKLYSWDSKQCNWKT